MEVNKTNQDIRENKELREQIEEIKSDFENRFVGKMVFPDGKVTKIIGGVMSYNDEGKPTGMLKVRPEEVWDFLESRIIQLFTTELESERILAVRQFATWYASKAPKHRQMYILELADKWNKEFNERIEKLKGRGK